MKREYIFLIVGLILIWILGFFLFMPKQNEVPEKGISSEGVNTTINK